MLVNGSTGGMLAAVLACVQLWSQRHASDGGGASSGGAPVVLLPRNVHKSAIHALVLSGAQPGWLRPEYDAPSGLSLGIPPAEVERALAAYGERVAAVLLVSPTYHGVVSDVAAAARLAAAAAVPLIVDEAHGAHLGFLPPPPPPPPAAGGHEGAMWPASALSQGASLAVQSTHKVLGSLTQSAMLHASGAALELHPGLAAAVGAALEQ
eukprot:5907663-Prymnesium_polylepis.1